jgi:hypothetical protein
VLAILALALLVLAMLVLAMLVSAMVSAMVSATLAVLAMALLVMAKRLRLTAGRLDALVGGPLVTSGSRPVVGGHGDEYANDANALKAGHVGALLDCSLVTTMHLPPVVRYSDGLMKLDPVGRAGLLGSRYRPQQARLPEVASRRKALGSRMMIVTVPLRMAADHKAAVTRS